MYLLEDCYNNIILNEKLKNIGLNDDIIKKELDKQYDEYVAREQSTGAKIAQDKEGWYRTQANDVKVISDILLSIPAFDTEYRNIIVNNANNLQLLKRKILQKDINWNQFLSNSDRISKGFLRRQPSNLALIKFINQMFESLVRIPIVYNEYGFPRYPFHSINKFLIMNVLENLYNQKQLDAKTKKFVEGIIFDERTKNEISDEMNSYIQRTTHNPEIPESPLS